MMRAHQGPRGAIAVALVALVALACGCGTGSSDICRVDSDCGGNGACVAGRCMMVSGTGEDAAPAASDLAATADLAIARGDGGGGDLVAPTCNFNGDGVIERSEAPFLVGLGALFLVNGAGQDSTVDVRGAGGTWDFTGGAPGDHKFFDELIAPQGAWWAPDFPSATFAQRIDANQPALGLYRATNASLDLLGVASEQGGVGRTELTYATPIQLLRFPLAKGSTWTSESDVSGLASGVYYFAHEKYQMTVDARGTTKVPAGSFDTLRLRVDSTNTYGFAVTARILYIHLAECYGAVARVRSKDNETSAAFTQAAEYRRLTTP
jgi:hypothetical protein